VYCAVTESGVEESNSDIHVLFHGESHLICSYKQNYNYCIHFIRVLLLFLKPYIKYEMSLSQVS
jgi:hypothetical protein